MTDHSITRDERYALCKRHNTNGSGRLSCYHTQMVHGVNGCQYCACRKFVDDPRRKNLAATSTAHVVQH